MTDGEIIYTASDVYKRLEVKDSTLRKYVEVLQREGYNFDKDKQGRRRYQKHDIIILEELVELNKYDGITLEKAAKIIVNQLNVSTSNGQEKKVDELILFNLQRQYSVMLDKANTEQKRYLYEMEERISKQINQSIATFTERFDCIESKEEEQIKNRDDILIQTFRSQQENKQLLLQIQEEIAATSKEVQRPWWKFWA